MDAPEAPTPPIPTVADLRRSYTRAELLVCDLAADPFCLFSSWLVDALAAGLPELNVKVVTIGVSKD